MGNEKKLLKFDDDIKQKIVGELKKRAEKLGISESVTIVDGFVDQPFTKELSDNFIIGGPTIPMIMLLGNESCRVYHFALKALLKDLEL
jgi:hypothetical protein